MSNAKYEYAKVQRKIDTCGVMVHARRCKCTDVQIVGGFTLSDRLLRLRFAWRLQCFDLESYLRINCERGIWRCPMCRLIRICFGQLIRCYILSVF